MAYNIKAKSHKGFTIVELMIAISVFAVAMTMVMAGVLFIGRQYQQAAARVAIEEASRNVHQQVTQAMKFTGDSSSGGIGPTNYDTECVGNEMYIFGDKANKIFNEGDYNGQEEGLYVGEKLPSCDASAVDVTAATSGFTNILPSGAKVIVFNVSEPLFNTVIVKAPSGGGDLLDFSGPIVRCNISLAGKEFCSVVSFYSVAEKRI